MKFAIAHGFAFIHLFALGGLAKVTGQTLGLETGLTGLLILVSIPIAFFPIVRTVAMLALLLFLVPWWKAILLTMAIAAVLLFIEGLGKTMLKTLQTRRV